MAAERFSVDLGGGGATTGCHYPAGGVVLFVCGHGAGAGQSHPFLTRIAAELAARGIDVVTFDFPYIHAKRRVPDRPPVLEATFRRVLEAASQRVASARAIFIGGKSMGGRIATQMGAEGVARLQGIAVFGYPLHPPGKPDRLRVDHLPDVAVPVLFIQGERDAFGTPDELRPFAARMAAPATVHVVPGGDHSLGSGRPPTVDYKGLADVVKAWMTACSRDQSV